METPLCDFGHVATTAELRRAGFTAKHLAALRRHPLTVQPRRGLYACGDLNSTERTAVRCGGRIDCVSLLRSLGVWVGDAAPALHLRFPTSGGRTSQRRSEIRRTVVAHWRPLRRPGGKLYVPVADALRQAMDCLPPDDLIAAIESAVHLGHLSREAALELMATAPARKRRFLREVDTGFRAQSGLETKVRLRFTRLGYRVEPQAAIPGVGHVDNLIEGVVALETNGRDHEGSRSTDYYRDLGTEAWGIRVISADPALLDQHWDMIQHVVEKAIADERLLRELRGRDLDGAPKKTPRRSRLWNESLPHGTGRR